MTKATLFIVASLTVAAALLAVACGGPPAGEEPDRRSRTERQERQRDTPEPVATAIPGETPSGLSSPLGPRPGRHARARGHCRSRRNALRPLQPARPRRRRGTGAG